MSSLPLVEEEKVVIVDLVVASSPQSELFVLGLLVVVAAVVLFGEWSSILDIKDDEGDGGNGGGGDETEDGCEKEDDTDDNGDDICCDNDDDDDFKIDKGDVLGILETTSSKAPPALFERDSAAVWTDTIETLLSSDTRLVAADAIRPRLVAIFTKEDDDRLDSWVDDDNVDFGSIRWSGDFILDLFFEGKWRGRWISMSVFVKDDKNI